MAKFNFYRLMGVDTPFDPERRFTTSWIIPPLALSLIRFLISLYVFLVHFVAFGIWDSTGDSIETRQSFSYFTHLTYWGLGFYFAFSGIHTLQYARTGATWIDRWPKSLQALHSLLYSTAIFFPWIVTVVYWAIIYDGFSGTFALWSNVSWHGLNSVFAFFEISCTRTNPPPFLHLWWLIIILAFYLALAYLTHATEGFYVYSFLNIQKKGSGTVAAYCIGILVACVVVFLIVWGIIWIRKWATENKLGMSGKLVSRERGTVIQDMEMDRV